jgi:hypothetical protein
VGSLVATAAARFVTAYGQNLMAAVTRRRRRKRVRPRKPEPMCGPALDSVIRCHVVASLLRGPQDGWPVEITGQFEANLSG